MSSTAVILHSLGLDVANRMRRDPMINECRLAADDPTAVDAHHDHEHDVNAASHGCYDNYENRLLVDRMPNS